MKIEIKVLGETLKEESAAEMIYRAISTEERGTCQGNVFNFKIESVKHDRAWRVLKAISDILDIKP